MQMAAFKNLICFVQNFFITSLRTDNPYLVLHDHAADHGEEVFAVQGQRSHVTVKIVQRLLDADGTLQNV
jgi:hypothetical protein